MIGLFLYNNWLCKCLAMLSLFLQKKRNKILSGRSHYATDDFLCLSHSNGSTLLSLSHFHSWFILDSFFYCFFSHLYFQLALITSFDSLAHRLLFNVSFSVWRKTFFYFYFIGTPLNWNVEGAINALNQPIIYATAVYFPSALQSPAVTNWLFLACTLSTYRVTLFRLMYITLYISSINTSLPAFVQLVTTSSHYLNFNFSCLLTGKVMKTLWQNAGKCAHFLTSLLSWLFMNYNFK